MWVSQYLAANSFSDRKASAGEVASSSADGSAVRASNEYFGIAALAPYGVSSVPVPGCDAVVVHTDTGDFLLSVMKPDYSLEAGEIELRSAGGASIVLKNDGSVLINGRVVE